MNFPFIETAIAADSHKPDPNVSTENLQIPFDWLAGTLLTTIVMVVSVIWWLGKLNARVDSNAENLKDLTDKLAQERQDDRDERKMIRKEISEGLKKDIAQSATDICHGFELFAVEIRAEIKKLSEGLDARNATVNHLRRKVDYLGSELQGLERQLNAQNIPVHYREFRDGPPSTPGNYDDYE